MTETKTEWELPLEAILAAHRARITDEELVPSMIETWHIGETEPSWTTWIGPTGPNVETRDAGLHALRVMASATGADYVLFSFDTHRSRSRVNPETGKPWEHGEMQRMCDTEGYCETGNIHNLVVAIIRRSDARLYFHSLPYHFHKGEVILYPDESVMTEWGNDPAATGTMSGLIPDSMREAVRSPTLTERMVTELGMTPDQFGLDAPDARLHGILGAVRFLSEAAIAQGEPLMFTCVLPVHNDHEEEIIKHSAERGGLSLLSSKDLREEPGD